MTRGTPLQSPSQWRPFEVFCVFRQGTTEGEPPRVMASMPCSSNELLRQYPMLERFCFAERPGCGDGGEVQFTFVLTSEDGMHMYGHCVRTVNAEVLCIVSRFAWCRLFRDLMFQYRANGEDPRIIAAVQRASVPSPGHHFVLRPPPPPPPPPPTARPGPSQTTAVAAAVQDGPASSFPLDLSTVELKRPPDGINPFVDAHPALLLRWMDTDTLLATMASLLTERRIAVVGPDVGTVSSVILALLSLLRPFEWAHVLVPIVPDSLLGVLAAPTPLLVGLLAHQVSEALTQGGVSNVVVVRLRGCDARVAVPSMQRGGSASTVSTPGAESLGSLGRTASSFLSERDREAGFSSPIASSGNSGSSVLLVEGSEFEDGTLPVPTLPFSSFALCSLRLAITKAKSVLKRRQSSKQRGGGHSQAAKAATLEADRGLLNAFLDYYVATFGLSLTPDDPFNPLTFIEDTVKRQSASSSRRELQAAEDFFAAAMECIIYLQFRDRYVPALVAAQNAAAGGRADALAGLPETAGFAEAVLLAHPALYPDAAFVALENLKQRESERGGVSSTLVTLSAPFWSLRALSGLCSYGISTASRKMRSVRRGDGQPEQPASPTDFGSPPLSPAR